MKLSYNYIFVAILLLSVNNLFAQTQYSKAVTATAMDIWKDSFALDGKPAKWTYDQGVILEGVAVAFQTAATPSNITPWS